MLYTYLYSMNGQVNLLDLPTLFLSTVLYLFLYLCRLVAKWYRRVRPIMYIRTYLMSFTNMAPNSTHIISTYIQAFLVQSPWDLTKYHSVLVYWRTRCLPPTTGGVLSIMGLVAVQDVSYYLQYYSLPVLTALCTPIVTIVMSLRKVYAKKS